MIAFMIGASVFAGGSIASASYLGATIPGLLGVIASLFVGAAIAKK